MWKKNNDKRSDMRKKRNVEILSDKVKELFNEIMYEDDNKERWIKVKLNVEL